MIRGAENRRGQAGEPLRVEGRRQQRRCLRRHIAGTYLTCGALSAQELPSSIAVAVQGYL